MTYIAVVILVNLMLIYGQTTRDGTNVTLLSSIDSAWTLPSMINGRHGLVRTISGTLHILARSNSLPDTYEWKLTPLPSGVAPPSFSSVPQPITQP